MILISTKIQLYKSWHLPMPKLRVTMDPILFLTYSSQQIVQTTLFHVAFSCLDHCSSFLTSLSVTPYPTPFLLSFSLPLLVCNHHQIINNNHQWITSHSIYLQSLLFSWSSFFFLKLKTSLVILKINPTPSHQKASLHHSPGIDIPIPGSNIFLYLGLHYYLI